MLLSEMKKIKKEIEKLELVDGNTSVTMCHQLTDWVGKRSDIEFAIDQLAEHNPKRWQLRKEKDGTLAVFTEVL